MDAETCAYNYGLYIYNVITTEDHHAAHPMHASDP